jgi:hypothetical protein
MANETKPFDAQKSYEELDKRIVALGERVEKLEKIKPGSVPRDLVDAVNAIHLQVMGVPAGKLQTLHDEKSSD